MDDLEAMMQEVFEDFNEEETEDFSALSVCELVDQLHDIDAELLHDRKLLVEGDQKHRDLQSRRTAIVVILNERGIL